MEEISIESTVVDEEKKEEEDEVTVAEKKEERSTVAPQQADTVGFCGLDWKENVR